MKIRSIKDVELLDRKIQDELGIQVKKYADENAVDRLIEILLFPKFIVKWGIRPVLISLAIFICGFYVLHLPNVEAVIYFLLGIILFVAIGVLSGVLFVFYKLSSDVRYILQYSLEVMKSCLGDIKQVNHEVKARKTKKGVLTLLFKGVIHIVTIPTLGIVIRRKIPLFGNVINFLFRKILTLVTNTIRFDVETEEPLGVNTLSKSSLLELYEKRVSQVSNDLDKLIGMVFKTLGFPLKLVLGILLFILFLFLRIMH